MIPLATTTITHKRATETEPGEGRTFTTIASRVRAVIGSPSGREALLAGGGRESVDAVLVSDQLDDAAHTDTITDETSGDVWEIVWLQDREGLGLAHTKAGLRRVAGVV